MSKKESSREKLCRWFMSLTPQERLAMAEEIEKFRREARIVRDSDDNEDPE